MKKYIFIILAAAIFTGFVSCGDTYEKPATDTTVANESETESETTENVYADDLPKLDFGGEEFRMMTFDQTTLTWARAALDISEQTGDLVNDSVFKRNRAVEERLNVKINQLVRPFQDNDLAKMRQWIMSGENNFEIGMEFVGNSRTLALEGLLYSYDDLEYVNLDKGYWCQDLNKSTSIANKHFLVYGDYSLSTHDNTSILIFNKDLYKDLNFGDDIYKTVKDGTWTFNVMNKKMNDAVFDINGDSKMDDMDRYGYVAAYKEILPSFWIAAGETTIEKDSDDIPFLAIDGDTRFNDVFMKIFDMMWSDDQWRDTNIDSTVVSKLFIDNQALFSHSTLYTMEMLRDMDADFGIIPYPKYDTEQDKYYSRVGGGQFGCIPITNDKLEMTGAVMEALCSESRASVIPAYYEVALTSKYSRDEESSEMLDIILGNRVYDLGDTFWVNTIRDGTFRSMMLENNRNLASAIEKIKSSVQKSIDETVEGFIAAGN